MANNVQTFDINYWDYPSEILNIEQLERHLPISLSQAQLEWVQKQGYCIDAWISQISARTLAPDNFNYLIPGVWELETDQANSKKTYLLTGGMREILSPPSASEELKYNMKIAKTIIKHVHEAIPFSANHPRRSRIFRLIHDNDRLVKIQTIFSKNISISREKTDNPNVSLELINRTALEHKIGHCFEMSVVGYEYWETLQNRMIEMGANTPFPLLEIFHIVGGDHGFLVVGRNPQSLPAEYWNWGDKAMVCDVWTGGCYPAYHIEHYLMDYIDVIQRDNRLYTIVKPFDPSRQVLAKLI